LQTAGKSVFEKMTSRSTIRDALGTNLQAGDLASWIEADEETSVAQHVSEDDVAASVRNGKTTDELGASDTRMTQKIIVMIPVKWQYQN
jgi:hypothetical protein